MDLLQCLLGLDTIFYLTLAGLVQAGIFNRNSGLICKQAGQADFILIKWAALILSTTLITPMIRSPIFRGKPSTRLKLVG